MLRSHTASYYLSSQLAAMRGRYDTLPPNDAHLQRISDHVSAYLQIVRSQLLATIPKAIVHCMVGDLLSSSRSRDMLFAFLGLLESSGCPCAVMVLGAMSCHACRLASST
jgi:hypothetical protein